MSILNTIESVESTIASDFQSGADEISQIAKNTKGTISGIVGGLTQLASFVEETKSCFIAIEKAQYNAVTVHAICKKVSAVLASSYGLNTTSLSYMETITSSLIYSFVKVATDAKSGDYLKASMEFAGSVSDVYVKQGSLISAFNTTKTQLTAAGQNLIQSFAANPENAFHQLSDDIVSSFCEAVEKSVPAPQATCAALNTTQAGQTVDEL